jgi:hypothetical protein
MVGYEDNDDVFVGGCNEFVVVVDNMANGSLSSKAVFVCKLFDNGGCCCCAGGGGANEDDCIANGSI